jgi:hypothetical protein
LSIAVIAVSFVAGLEAQEAKLKEQTRIETDDAKMVTWTGCVRASKDGFDLTEVTRDTSTNGQKEQPPMPATVMLRTVPGTIDLQKYVGRLVAISGAAEKDVFEDIEVELRTDNTIQQKPRSETKSTTKAELDVDPRGHNILVPISVRVYEARINAQSPSHRRRVGGRLQGAC